MAAFRILLVFIFLVELGYTLAVGSVHGWNLLPVFFADIAAMDWPGQFNMDFTAFLTLSSLWTAWRHRFSAAGLGLGVLAFFGGIIFLAPYLFIASLKARGNVAALLLGPERAARA